MIKVTVWGFIDNFIAQIKLGMLKGYVTQKLKLYNLLPLMSFQRCMTFFHITQKEALCWLLFNMQLQQMDTEAFKRMWKHHKIHYKSGLYTCVIYSKSSEAIALCEKKIMIKSWHPPTLWHVHKISSVNRLIQFTMPWILVRIITIFKLFYLFI